MVSWPLYVVSAKILLPILIFASAASIAVTQYPYQSTFGAVLKIDSTLTAADKGFSRANGALSPAGTSCPSLVVFGVVSKANNNIVSGDVIYDVQLNTTANTAANACFTVTLTVTPSGGIQSNYSVFISNAAPNVLGQVIDCQFDIGTSLPLSPFSFKVTG